MNKRIITLIAYLCIAIGLPKADEISVHDNSLYISIGETHDITQVPIKLHLNNPTIDVTAVEMYLTLPNETTTTECLSDERCSDSHFISHGTTSNGYYISIASEYLENFEQTEGPICTLLCDFSSISSGTHNIKATDILVIGVNNNNITTYTTNDQIEQFSKSDDAITSIEKVVAKSNTLEIYNIQGIKLNKLQQGKINIVNGKIIRL